MLPTCHPAGGQHRVPAVGSGLLRGDTEPFEDMRGAVAALTHQACTEDLQMDVKCL